MSRDTVFTAQWAQHLIHNCERHLMHLAGRPLRCLEIGVFEGRSARWLFENLLTHPDSRYVGVDAWGWADRTEEKARRNLAPFQDRIEFRIGPSAQVLRGEGWASESFDLIYIDGCHRAFSVLSDTCLAWPLLRVGGTCVWDDYQWRAPIWKRRRAPAHERPREAVDALLMALASECELVFKNYQVGVRKTARPPGPYQPGLRVQRERQRAMGDAVRSEAEARRAS